MRRAIVHIGMPRTGSTTIQTVLARLRPQLEAAAGILYPDLNPASAAHAPHISHQYLGEVLDGRRPRREARELLGALDAALARTQADTVILSYEDLIQEKRAAWIAAILRDAVARHGFRMEAVVTLKPQDEHLNSIYAHRVQMMNEKRLFASFAKHFEHSARFAYAELLQPWLPACDGRLRAVPVRDQRSPRPLLERFLTETGLVDRVLPLLAPEDTARRENRSPGPVAVEASRRLRLLRVPDRLRVPREMMRFLERAAASRGVDETPFQGVGPELRARLSARYAATNERFAAQAWGAPWSTVVAPEPERPANELGSHPIPPATERTIKELMEEACREFGVAPDRRWSAGPQELLSDAAEAIGRTFRISRWRVV